MFNFKWQHKSGCIASFFVTILAFGYSASNDGRIVSIKANDGNLEFLFDSASKDVRLIEMQPYQQYNSSQKYTTLSQGTEQDTLRVERFKYGRDLIYSKFALIDTNTHCMLGGYRYVTDIKEPINGISNLPRPKSIKGLSCIVDIDDAIELGVKYVHENIYINELVDADNDQPEAVYEFAGEKIPLNMKAVRKLDFRLQRFTKAGIAVFGVFLNKMPKERKPGDPRLHPNSDVEGSPTHLGAFNVTSAEGLKYYLATLEFLADRYTRQDAKYGLISSVIIGNEIQQHWTWYNMGDVPEQKAIQDYLIALRLGWLALQKYHSDLRVYVSMDHHWTKRGPRMNELREIPGDVLLKSISVQAKAEGDFPWNVAFHPYPENLFESRFWLDKSTTDDFATPRITFKNLDVLPRFLKQPNLLYQGHVRDIALTEQGFHTPDGPDGEKIQAAAYAYAYYKISRISEISAFILHRHVDHREEGGLRLGLWTAGSNAVSPESPLKKKYIWEVFKYADTPHWERYFEFAKPIIGIKGWSDTPTNTGPVVKSVFTVDKDSIIYDFVTEFDAAQKINNLQCEPKDILRAAGWMVPAIFQHPPADGVGELTYQVNLPLINEGDKIRLLFETMLAHKSTDGVRYSISIDGKEIWTAVGIDTAPVSYDIDLVEWSGREVDIGFGVDKISNTDYDWSYWIKPIITKQ